MRLDLCLFQPQHGNLQDLVCITFKWPCDGVHVSVPAEKHPLKGAHAGASEADPWRTLCQNLQIFSHVAGQHLEG